LAALFPAVTFDTIGPDWPDRADSRFDVLIVAVNALKSAEVEAAARRLKAAPAGQRIVVVLFDADVTTTRRLHREGAADVLLAPVSEPALAISLERLLASAPGDVGGGPAGKSGQIVAFLKAGGGVGATALATQLAVQLANRDAGQVCMTDLDLQFGAVGLYLDLPDAVTVMDFLGVPQPLSETPFATALTKHRSGLKVLSASRDLAPLEALAPPQIDSLFAGLRRDFALTLVDLPSSWTAWTNQALHLADRIVLVTELSVPHVNAVKRQIKVMGTQGLHSKPVILVCNGLSSDHTATLSIKAAERAIGRAFDVVLPEDRRTMCAAINQGVELSAVRRGTKLEKGLVELGDKVAADALVGAQARLGR
jgi:Flp pilus assembly CpaE family ATPase